VLFKKQIPLALISVNIINVPDLEILLIVPPFFPDGVINDRVTFVKNSFGLCYSNFANVRRRYTVI
jgi:hypothetical protein